MSIKLKTLLTAGIVLGNISEDSDPWKWHSKGTRLSKMLDTFKRSSLGEVEVSFKDPHWLDWALFISNQVFRIENYAYGFLVLETKSISHAEFTEMWENHKSKVVEIIEATNC